MPRTGNKAWVGTRNDAHLVFWNEPDGTRKQKSCGTGRRGAQLARSEAQRIHAELVAGTYETVKGGTWKDFTKQYERDVIELRAIATAKEFRKALSHFQRIIKPAKMARIKTATIDRYKAARLKEKGQKPGATVQPATVNKELRHLKAAFRKAQRWGYMADVPHFDFLREDRTEKGYCNPDDFAAIYGACETARTPNNLQGVTAGEWWQALLTTLYMTGWRIGETLALRWEDVDMVEGVVKLRANTTKGRKASTIRLHPIAIEHLRKIKHFGLMVFAWPKSERTLYTEFYRIQKAAGIDLQCVIEYEHDCTEACHLYGFHDDRRAFATLNAENLTGDALQRLMRHSSYSTTQRYINMAKQLDAATEAIHVPEVLRAAKGGA